MQEVFQGQNQPAKRPIKRIDKGSIAHQEPQRQEGLTREQYKNLLKMAWHMRKMPAYLAMRMFVCTGVQMQDFLALTVEAVQTGEITTAERIIHLPDSLREELLEYARRSGVRSGAIFVGKAGATMGVATIRDQIRAVSRAAGLEDGMVTTKTLQKLYETTHAQLMAETVQRLMLEQLDAEQAEHGWES